MTVLFFFFWFGLLRNLVWGVLKETRVFWHHTAGENRDKYKDDDDVTADVVMSVTCPRWESN